jgi:hypothetical protein
MYVVTQIELKSMRNKRKLYVEQIRFGRVVIPNLTLPGNPGSNLILVTEIEIQFVFPDESRKLPWIITAAREHLPTAVQRGVFRHSPPIPGSKLLFK